MMPAMNEPASLARPTLLLAGLLLAAPALAKDPSVEMRGAARMIVGVERPLEKRDLPGYCKALYGGAAYRSYLSQLCDLAIKKDVIEGQSAPTEKSSRR